jgi:hypothetical protein
MNCIVCYKQTHDDEICESCNIVYEMLFTRPNDEIERLLDLVANGEWSRRPNERS